MENESSNKGKEPTLIINMDINRTIIFQDKAKGSSIESSIKLSITKEIWGTIDKKANKWILYDDKISIEKPNNNPELIKYLDYIKKIKKTKTKEENS